MPPVEFFVDTDITIASAVSVDQWYYVVVRWRPDTKVMDVIIANAANAWDNRQQVQAVLNGEPAEINRLKVGAEIAAGVPAVFMDGLLAEFGVINAWLNNDQVRWWFNAGDFHVKG